MSSGLHDDDRASIAEQTREALPRLTARERKAAQMLLSNYPTTGLAPVAEFAERAQVSAPTVLRFVAKLGFQGYPDFQRQLREELEAQLASPLAKPAPEVPTSGVFSSAVPRFGGVSTPGLRSGSRGGARRRRFFGVFSGNRLCDPCFVGDSIRK